MEKRILIAAILSAVFMTWYAQSVLKGARTVSYRSAAPAANPAADKPPSPQLKLPVGFDEDSIMLESPQIQVEIGTESAAIRSVILNDFLDASKIGPLRIRSEQPLLSVLSGGEPLQWNLTTHSSETATFVSNDKHGNGYNISYELKHSNSNLDIVLTTLIASDDYKPESLGLFSGWAKGDSLPDRQNSLELFAVQDD